MSRSGPAARPADRPIPDAPLDLLCVGRASMDLFAAAPGPFEAARAFDAQPGGSPANIAIGAARLGLRAGLLGAVGDDRVGGWLRRALRTEGLAAATLHERAGARTPLALVGLEPPASFPLTFYRAAAPDLRLGLEALPRPLGAGRVLLSGAALAASPLRELALALAERARAEGAELWCDLDLRSSLWPDPRAYGPALRALLPRLDVVLGTEEEGAAALGVGPEGLDAAVAARLARTPGPRAWVVKRGDRGATLHRPDAPPLDAAAWPVEVASTVGAGDAFAAALIAARAEGRAWPEALRRAAAAAAWVVARPGCSSALPTRAQLERLLAGRSGEETP